MVNSAIVVGHYYEVEFEEGETTLVEVLEWPSLDCWLVREILSGAKFQVLTRLFKAELNEMQVLALVGEGSDV